MTGTRPTWPSIAALALLLTVAGLASAGSPSSEDASLPAEPVEAQSGALEAASELEAAAEDPTTEEPSPLAEVGAALATAGQALLAATQATANAIAQAGLLVAQALQAVGDGIATATVWTATTLWTGLTWTGQALWTGIVGVGDALAWTGLALFDGASWLAAGIATATVWLATRTGDLLVWTGHSLAGAASWTAALVAGAATDLAALVAASWPETTQGQAIAAGSTTATAAAAGAAWYTRPWRYLSGAPLLAPLYTRIRPDELLEHPKRADIYRIIEENPGIHLSELDRELDSSWGTLLHHLRKLEQGELVTSTETGGKRCFFLPGQVPHEQRSILPALENEKARAIAEYYAENPGASQAEAADALDLSAALVSWHLNKLEDAGVVTRHREGRCQRVGVTQEAMAVVAA